MPFGLTFGTPENWMWFLAGGATVFVFLAFVLPDDVAATIVRRRNFPATLQILAYLGLLITAWNILVLALGVAVIQALSRARIEPWVWVVLGVSVLLLVAAWLVPWLVTRVVQQSQQPQGPQP